MLERIRTFKKIFMLELSRKQYADRQTSKLAENFQFAKNTSPGHKPMHLKQRCFLYARCLIEFEFIHRGQVVLRYWEKLNLTLSLYKFSSDAHQLSVYMIAM